LWPITWAADGNLYTSWGDGTGFGDAGNDFKGPIRRSMGFSRIEAAPNDLIENPAPNPTAFNVYGGQNAENPNTLWDCDSCGKSMGMISVKGVLYAWINTQNGEQPDFKLTWSDDLGATWRLAEWKFTGDSFAENTFLNFGKDYAGARDGFVYVYGFNRETATSVELARVPKDKIKDRKSYEWFTGTDKHGAPVWSSSILDRKPVFQDPNGISVTSVSYDPGIKCYLLVTAHGKWENSIGKLGVFDAPEPWGPWATVEYNQNWGGFTGAQNGYHIVTKTPDWMSPDGLTIHLVFSGQHELDSFNVVKGTLVLRKPAKPSPRASVTGSRVQ
jgi:hypothetical protein